MHKSKKKMQIENKGFSLADAGALACELHLHHIRVDGAQALHQRHQEREGRHGVHEVAYGAEQRQAGENLV